jgi:hypothetical protein
VQEAPPRRATEEDEQDEQDEQETVVSGRSS